MYFQNFCNGINKLTLSAFVHWNVGKYSDLILNPQGNICLVLSHTDYLNAVKKWKQFEVRLISDAAALLAQLRSSSGLNLISMGLLSRKIGLKKATSMEKSCTYCHTLIL